MKKALSIITLLFLMAVTMQAQDASTTLSNQKPDWQRWHYLSEEEMYDTSRGMNFVETNPPAGEPRFVAEFEPMQGVMISYAANYGGFGIPVSLIAQLANNCHLYCVVPLSYQNDTQNTMQNGGVNMNNVTFVNTSVNSYWIRDYGPWYIFEDRQPAIVDNVYNRPRPNDDEVPSAFASFWNIPMYGMNLQHTGGNMMEDGRGHGVSDDLVLQENSYNETNVRNKMRDYLGIDPYHITIDPQGDYIAHVDCWGKYLAPDKILIARLPQNNSHYADYEEVANYFASTNCCWGYPYRVYRVDEPGGNTLAPYTNSLILNKTVYVPLGSNNTYNNNALAVYQEAMPGYNIVGVNYNTYSGGWQNTDALHCRTRGVMDFEMLFVDHRDVLFGEQEWQDSIPVVSKFIAYSGANLKQDSLLVYYSIDNGAYQVAHMTATGNPDEYVGYIKGYQGESEIEYYVFGADESGHRYTQPVFAELDPHHFTMEAHEMPQGELVITPDTLWFNQMGVSQEFVINNETTDAVTIYSVVPEQPSLNIWEPSFPYTLQPGQSVAVTIDYQPAPGKDNYNMYDILISTSLGERHVTAMVLQTAMDAGLVVVGAPVIELEDFNADYRQLQNRNFGTLIPIKIISIEEQETDYLIVEPQHTLPYVMDAGEYFEVGVRLNPDRSTKGYATTTVIIESDDRQCEIAVAINEDLLTVTELSTEAKLYPNPTTSQFTVEGANIDKVEVFNLVGQKVYEQQGNKVVNIDATQWNKGIYLVNIIEKNGAAVTKKLVVK